MKKRMFILFLLACSANSWSQIENDNLDYKYLEDQIYLSVSYNILRNKPAEDSNTVFSSSFSLGFIRDIPLNKKRNVGLGIGLGYAFNSYRNSITLYNDEGGSFGVVEEYQTNKFKTNLVELPIEFRWRTSTASKYNFWRIYGGVKFAYTFYSISKFDYNGASFTKKNADILNKFQYGAILSAGYGTWNIYTYYGLSQLFKGVNSTGEEINLMDFSLGLKFYIM